MGDLHLKADAFLEIIKLHVAEVQAFGLPSVAAARLLFGFSVLLLERADGREGAARFLRHQLRRLEKAVPPR
jgi:hypothetical protein